MAVILFFSVDLSTCYLATCGSERQPDGAATYHQLRQAGWGTEGHRRGSVLRLQVPQARPAHVDQAPEPVPLVRVLGLQSDAIRDGCGPRHQRGSAPARARPRGLLLRLVCPGRLSD